MPQCIVLVDDNATTNFLNQTIIERSAHGGIPVKAYSNPKEALQYLEKPDVNGSHLIFLDINMPIMDGWAFTKVYSQNSHHDQNVLIMLTSSVDPMDEDRAKRNDVIRDFRSKPLTFEMLDEVLTEYFKKS